MGGPHARKDMGYMYRHGIRLLCLLALVACTAATARADFKVKTRTSVGGRSFEGTTLIKGARQRTETDMGIKTVSITQCDLKRTIQINEPARTYYITPFDDGSAGETTTAPNRPTPQGPPTQTARGGVVTYAVNTVDTGERKQMFGLTARHIKTTMAIESSPDACSPIKMRMEMDGWYVDLSPEFSCPTDRPDGAPNYMPSKPDCRDRIQFKRTGSGKSGYPLQQTTTMFGEDGRVASTMSLEVVELSQAALDPALFDLPAGYTQARSMQELYSGNLAAMMNRRDGDDDNSSSATTTPATPAPSAASEGATLGAKQPGVVRVGLMRPSAQMQARDGGVANDQASSSVQTTLAEMLRRPGLEVVALDAQTPDAALEEARRKECDYLLLTGVKQKKGGGGMFGGLGNVAGAVTGQVPYGSSAGTAAPRTTGVTAVDMASSVRAKDEVTIDYNLQSLADGRPVLQNTGKAKAKSDGEDVFTPLLQKEADAVAAAVAQK